MNGTKVLRVANAVKIPKMVKRSQLFASKCLERTMNTTSCAISSRDLAIFVDDDDDNNKTDCFTPCTCVPGTVVAKKKFT